MSGSDRASTALADEEALKRGALEARRKHGEDSDQYRSAQATLDSFREYRRRQTS